MTDKSCPIIPYKYICNLCNYFTSSKKDYNKHIHTLKHMKADKILTLNSEKSHLEPSIKLFECDCGNIYKHRQSLHKHKTMCNKLSGYDKIVKNEEHSNNPSNSGFVIDKEIVMTMLLQNQEMMKKVMEILPNVNQTTNNNINTNCNYTTNNNQFNIQMFLNEHCKNAMNLTDFIDSLPITADTYNSTIENGLTKTITNMLLNGLSQLDILERPIHCTDASRKTLYVKDDNTWEKDNELLHILKGIKKLSIKQRTMLNKWQDVNVGWDTMEDLQSRMTKLVYNSMTSIEHDDKETGKIIRAISKKVYLDTDTKEKFNQIE